MRKLAWFSFVLIPMLLVAGIKLRTASHSSQVPPEANQQESSPSPLTPEEENDLRKLTQQALFWALVWNPQPTNCLKNGQAVPLNLIQEYERLKGAQIEATLTIREHGLSIFLPALHIGLGFVRLHEAGLGPPSLEYFCENTYDEHVTAVRQMAEQTRDLGEEIRRRAKSDPQAAKILEQMEKKEAEKPLDQGERMQARSYKVPMLVKQPPEPPESWSEEKRWLFKRVADVVRKEVKGIYCEPAKITRITIPNFNVGDPSVYVLVEPPPSHGSSMDETVIFWLKFSRDASNAHYDAYVVKSLGLPDEVAWYRPLIEERRAKVWNILCRKEGK